MTDTSRVAPPVPPEYWWDSTWLLSCLAPESGDTLTRRDDLYTSSALLLSETMARDTAVGIHPSGTHGGWELPYGLSPGTDRLALWFDGTPTTGPVLLEALTHTVTPLVLEDLRALPPDPFLDPLAAAGDGILWGTGHRPRWEESPSAVRLTQAAFGTNTQDAMLSRQAGSWRVMGSYAHSRSGGRILYGTSRYQNVFVHLDRAASFGGLHLVAAGRHGRYDMLFDRAMIWETFVVSGASQFRVGASVSGQVYVAHRGEKAQWWGHGDSALRETNSTEATAHVAADLRGVTFLASGGLDWTALRFTSDLRQDEWDWKRISGGLAVGARTGDERRSALLTAGFVDPWWQDPQLRGHLNLAARLGPRVRAAVDVWTTATPFFVPRAEPDAAALLETGLLTPAGAPAENAPARRLWHAEVRATLHYPWLRLGCGLFGRRMENGLGLDPQDAALLQPGIRDTVPIERLQGDATLAGVRLDARLRLPYGFGIQGDITGLPYPQAKELPVFTAPFHGRWMLSVGHSFFKDDLHLELRAVQVFRGSWVTPYDELPLSSRIDGEIHGTFLENAHLFFAVQNLEDKLNASSTYENGWMALPPRSYRAGLEWRFHD